MIDPICYQLKHPITTTFKGPEGERQETTAELTLRRPNAGDMRVMDDVKGEVGASIAMIARLSGLAVVQVEKLDAEDFVALSGVVGDFLPDSLPTGLTPSET